jgi:hypothetical protein
MASRRSKLDEDARATRAPETRPCEEVPAEFRMTEGMQGATRDELWAHAFLSGGLQGDLAYSEGVSYLRGKAEARGREALVRVLELALAGEKDLPVFLGYDLLVLFADDARLKAVLTSWPTKNGGVDYFTSREKRKLVFKFRSRHWRSTEFKDFDIHNFIERRLRDGEKLEAVLEDAKKEFRLKERAIHDARKRVKKQL